MEDEYDLEVEIERQLAQEEEEMAEMQENIANQKLALQATKVSLGILKDEIEVQYCTVFLLLWQMNNSRKVQYYGLK